MLRRWLSAGMAGIALCALGQAGDWIVFQRNDDNFPVSLAPYSGLPLVMLVAWFLIDRFVRTTESLESLNRELETRVERKSAELMTAVDAMRAARQRGIGQPGQEQFPGRGQPRLASADPRARPVPGRASPATARA